MVSRKKDVEERVGFGVADLGDVKKMEKLFCSGESLPSPAGGMLVRLGARPEPDGTSWVLLECPSSSLRFQLPIRKATKGEKVKVQAQLDAGEVSLCPRGGLGPPLVRRGKDLYCPRCNIKYGAVT